MAEDIINGFVRTLLEIHPDTPRTALARVEQQLRQQWGGVRVYVQKAGQMSDAVKELADREGVSRATAYRMLRRSGRPRR